MNTGTKSESLARAINVLCWTLLALGFAYGLVRLAAHAIRAQIHKEILRQMPLPPMPTRQPEPEPPLQIAHAAAFCYPSLTDDVIAEKRDKCHRVGGESSTSRREVSCWSSHPYDDGSVMWWKYTIDDALKDDQQSP